MNSGDPIVSMADSHQSEVPNSGFDAVMEKVSSVFNSTVDGKRLDECAMAVSLLGETGNFELLSEKDVERSTFLKAFGGLTIAKESKEGDDIKSTKNNLKNVQDRGIAIKHSNPRSIMTSLKSQDEKSGSITLNKPSASFPTVESAKPRRVGRLPSYGFSLRCDKRAQKRKEFQLKLEEKNHAKEVEQSTLQAKSKESLELEVKMLRRSLTFKANPMPSFYHEPAPTKVEFKKIAPTRARSPKLGRHKRSASELSSNCSSQSVHLNLDEKVTQNPPTKESSLGSFKKPLQKSLPRPLSEKTTTLANTTEDATFHTQLTEQHKIEQKAQSRANIRAMPNSNWT